MRFQRSKMIEWEYNIKTIDISDSCPEYYCDGYGCGYRHSSVDSIIDYDLANLGNDGWELVNFSNKNNSFIFIFKRPKNVD